MVLYQSAEGVVVSRSASDDIEMVERWGYTRGEALELVARPAVFAARRMAGNARVGVDRDALEWPLPYLADLRSLCLAAAEPSHAVA